MGLLEDRRAREKAAKDARLWKAAASGQHQIVALMQGVRDRGRLQPGLLGAATPLPGGGGIGGVGETVHYMTAGFTIGTGWTDVPLGPVDDGTLDGRRIDELPATGVAHSFATIGYKRVRIGIDDCPVGDDGIELRVLVDGVPRGKQYSWGSGTVLVPDEWLIGRIVPGELVTVQVRSAGSHPVTGVRVEFEHIDVGGQQSEVIVPTFADFTFTSDQDVDQSTTRPLDMTATAVSPANTVAGETFLVLVTAAVHNPNVGGSAPRSLWTVTLDPAISLAGTVQHPSDVDTGEVYVGSWVAPGAGAQNVSCDLQTSQTSNAIGSIVVLLVRPPAGYPLAASPVGGGLVSDSGSGSGSDPTVLTVGPGAGPSQVGLTFGFLWWTQGSTVTSDVQWSSGDRLQQQPGSSSLGNTVSRQRWAFYSPGASGTVTGTQTQGSTRMLAVGVPINVVGGDGEA